MAQLGPKHAAEWILPKGYRCVRRNTIVLCFKMEHIRKNEVKIKILTATQQQFYGQFISSATIEHTQVSMWSAVYFVRILTKFGLPRKIFHKSPNINFSHKCVQWDQRWHTDRRTDMTKVRSSFGQSNTPWLCKGYTNLQFSCTFIANSVIKSQIAICTSVQY